MSSSVHHNLRPLVTLLSFVCIVLLGPFSFADLIIDDFDSQAVKSGPGTPVGYDSFGVQLSDRGVSSSFDATSGTNSAFYVINFSTDFGPDNKPAFGVGAAHDGLSLSLDPNHFVSVQIKIQTGPVNGGFIGFRIADSDGTVLRTADTNLFAANGSFQVIYESLTAVNHVDFTGTTPGLDYSQIRSIGLLFFDRNFSGTTTVVFDDLKITAVPEPTSMMLVASGLVLAALRSGKLVRARLSRATRKTSRSSDAD